VDRRRSGVPIPLEYALVLYGERFGRDPVELEQSEDGSRIMHYLALIGQAEQIKADLEPLGVDGVMFWGDEE
jgi:hypothetical protein